MTYQKLTRLSMYLTLAIIFSILESMIPINHMIPGIKLGCANIILVLVLYQYGIREALAIAVLRVILMGILRTGLFSVTFFFSLFGTLFSVTSMYLTKKTHLSVIGVSIVGAIFHSIGQLLAAMLFLHLHMLIYYLPWMILGSIVTGMIIGYLSQYLLKQLEKTL